MSASIPTVLKKIDRPSLLRRTALVAVVFAVGIPATWLITSFARHEPLVHRLADRTQKIASPLESSLITDQAEFIDLHSAIQEDPSRTGEFNEDVLQRAIICSLGWMKACSSGNHDDYRIWAESAGYGLRDTFPADINDDPMRWKALCEYITGETMPEAPSPEEYFDAVLQATLAMADGALCPNRLVIDPKAIEIDSMVFSHPADTFDYFSPVNGDGFDLDFWYGGITVSGERFWDPPRSLDSIIRTDGQAQATRLRLVFEGKNGLRVPVHFVTIDDPLNKAAFLHSIQMTNIGPETGTGLDRMVGLVY